MLDTSHTARAESFRQEKKKKKKKRKKKKDTKRKCDRPPDLADCYNNAVNVCCHTSAAMTILVLRDS